MDREGDAVSTSRRLLAAAAITMAALEFAACGDENTPKAPAGVSQSTFERQLADAQRVSPADFPATEGKTLQQLADRARAGQQVGLATSVFVPGANRLAFGIMDAKNRFVYGKTAVYVARSPNSTAQGPYPAPADALLTEGRYRSKQAALEASPIASVYAAQVPFKRPGRYAVLVLTKTD